MKPIIFGILISLTATMQLFGAGQQQNMTENVSQMIAEKLKVIENRQDPKALKEVLLWISNQDMTSLFFAYEWRNIGTRRSGESYETRLGKIKKAKPNQYENIVALQMAMTTLHQMDVQNPAFKRMAGQVIKENPQLDYSKKISGMLQKPYKGFKGF